MRRAVEKGRALGIRIGVHTLTNFINTNDAYVSPVPDPRLARTGSSPLAVRHRRHSHGDPRGLAGLLRQREGELAAHGRDRPGADPVPRPCPASEPWTLLGCERGAFGTTAARAPRGRRRRQARRPPVQGLLPDDRSPGRNRAQPGDVVQQDRRQPAGLRRPRGLPGVRPGRLRAGPLRPGLLRHPRPCRRQRHEHLVAVLLAHQLVLQLGRAVVRRVPREHAGVPASRTRRCSTATSCRTCSGGTD